MDSPNRRSASTVERDGVTPPKLRGTSTTLSEVRYPSVNQLQAQARRWVQRRVGKREISSDTAKRQRRELRRFCAFVGGRHLHASTIESWWASIAKLAPGTRRNYLGTVTAFCAWLHQNKELSTNPVLDAELKAPKVPKRIHRTLEEEAEALFGACVEQRERLVLSLGFQAGLRRAEIASLEVGQVSFTQSTLRVIGKGDKERIIPLPAELRRELKAYLAETGTVAGPLIRSKRSPNQGVGPETIWLIFTTVAQRAGVKLRAHDGVAPHTMRHTAATDVARNCRDVKVVQEFLGHESSATTDIYINHLPITTIAEAVEGRCYCGRPSCDSHTPEVDLLAKIKASDLQHLLQQLLGGKDVTFPAEP